MIETVRIINRTIFKTPFTLFFSFVLPILLIVVGTLMWVFIGKQINIISIFASLSISTILCINLLSLPILVHDFKQMGFMERVTTTKLPTNGFVMFFSLYFVVLTFFYYIFGTLIGSLLILAFTSSNHFISLWTTADWWGIIYTVIVTQLLCGLFGVIIGYCSKKKLTIQITTISILLVSVFLCYFFVPYYLLLQEPNGNAIIYISYGWPFSYSTKMMIESWSQTPDINLHQSTIFDLHTPFYSKFALESDFYLTSSTVTDKYLQIFIPVFTIIFLYIINIFIFSDNNNNKDTKNKKKGKYE